MTVYIPSELYNSTPSTSNLAEITSAIAEQLCCNENATDEDEEDYLLVDGSEAFVFDGGKAYVFQLEDHINSRRIVNVGSVPWHVLNDWLSVRNGHAKPGILLPESTDIDDIISELERRRREDDEYCRIEERRHEYPSKLLMGYGRDWRELRMTQATLIWKNCFFTNHRNGENGPGNTYFGTNTTSVAKAMPKDSERIRLSG